MPDLSWVELGGTWPSVCSVVSRGMSRQEVLGSLSADSDWWACVPTQFAVYFENQFSNCGPSFFYITFESIFESVC